MTWELVNNDRFFFSFPFFCIYLNFLNGKVLKFKKKLKKFKFFKNLNFSKFQKLIFFFQIFKRISTRRIVQKKERFFLFCLQNKHEGPPHFINHVIYLK